MIYLRSDLHKFSTLIKIKFHQIRLCQQIIELHLTNMGLLGILFDALVNMNIIIPEILTYKDKCRLLTCVNFSTYALDDY